MWIIKTKEGDSFYAHETWTDNKDEAKGFSTKEEAELVIQRHQMPAEAVRGKGTVDG